MKKTKLILAILTLLATIVLCQQIVSNSLSNQENKKDSAELNHIKYGLFSINKWKEQFSLIIADEINKLYFTNANERELKKHVEIQLETLIDNVHKKMKDTNKKSAGGWVKQTIMNTFVDLDEIKEGIPGYADAIIQEMTKRKTEVHLKGIVKIRIEKYMNQTFDNQDLTSLNKILKRTGSTDIEAAKIKLNLEISKKNILIHNQMLALIILALILFALPGFSKKNIGPSQYILLILTLTVLLVAGVTIPMIDMEAKISKMSFFLLDHPILFENQVLYFQSKSILDVFWIMITHEDFKMQIVGVMMVAFSVLFPLLKMISSLGYYYNYREARENKLIQFFVLKSGKWSMADVLVVAIFMAYIGFNGIITSQFGNLSTEGQDLVILTTNGTSLEAGYYLFLSYTMLALFLSGFLTRKPYAAEVISAA